MPRLVRRAVVVGLVDTAEVEAEEDKNVTSAVKLGTLLATVPKVDTAVEDTNLVEEEEEEDTEVEVEVEDTVALVVDRVRPATLAVDMDTCLATAHKVKSATTVVRLAT
ncbi:hypothetical protein MMC25_008149 [Agyrium rufum]|nr:hypothetical protein [Agyrium rufum]